MPRTIHGMHKSPAYKRWIYMRRRCKKDPKYIRNGVTVCERWANSFVNFYADMGDPPPGMTLDRIDGTKGYSQANCRWATYKEQARNMKTNVRAGGELLVDIAERANVSRSTVVYRKKKGLTLDAPSIRKECKKGHAWTDKNTYVTTVKRKQGGTRLQRYCRMCRAAAQQNLRDRALLSQLNPKRT